MSIMMMAMITPAKIKSLDLEIDANVRSPPNKLVTEERKRFKLLAPY